MVHSRLFLAVWVFITLAYAATALARPLSEAEKDSLWARAYAQLSGPHSRLVYDNGTRTPPEYPGFITSNEYAHFAAPQFGGPAALHVGFATTINFNLIGLRRNNAFVLADQSPEVVTALASFWRPMWMISETPAEWLAHISGFEIKESESTEKVFSRISRGEPGSDKAIPQIRQKLQRLVSAGRLTELDRDFALAVVEDQISPPKIPDSLLPRLREGLSLPSEFSGIFRHSRLNLRIANMLSFLYDPSQVIKLFAADPSKSNLNLSLQEQFAEIEKEIEKKSVIRESVLETSFLLNPERYEHIRALYMNSQDFYALANIADKKLWSKLDDFATQIKKPITDLYVSNIPQIAAAQDTRVSTQINTGLLEIVKDGARLNVYETQDEFPYRVSGAPLSRQMICARHLTSPAK